MGNRENIHLNHTEEAREWAIKGIENVINEKYSGKNTKYSLSYDCPECDDFHKCNNCRLGGHADGN